MLHHVDRIPAALLNYFVDREGRPFHSHLVLDRRSNGTPPAAVVGAEERTAASQLRLQLLPGQRQFLLDLLDRFPLGFETLLLFRQPYTDAVLVQAVHVNRVNGEDPAEHNS